MLNLLIYLNKVKSDESRKNVFVWDLKMMFLFPKHTFGDWTTGSRGVTFVRKNYPLYMLPLKYITSSFWSINLPNATFVNPIWTAFFSFHTLHISRSRSLRSLKPRLHKRFFACDGDAIFLKLSRRQRAAKIACVATLWRSPWFFAKNSTHWISRDFFLRFFHLSHHLCEGGYTCDFLRALVTRQFSKKSHHHRKQKIARVAAA